MGLLSAVKRVSLGTGLYRPARWLSRRVRHKQLLAFRKDVEFFRSLIPEGALCFDVGANIGEKSEAMLEAGGRVVAFEPNPRVLPELLARCLHWKGWTVVQTALGSRAAIATLHMPEAHGSSSLDARWLSGSEEVETYFVPVVTLDAAIDVFGIPFYCKVDVEGWEWEVFLGLTRPIPLISFEFHLTEHGVKNTLACLARLAQCGHSLVNLTAAEGSSFHCERWVPIRDFLGWFPGDLSQTLPGHKYGDIFVKNDGT